jgi:citrate synthase
MAAAGSQVRKGLEGVVASQTAIGEVDGDACQLIYRGYPIGELVGRATYEEVSYLLLHGGLPTSAQLGVWSRQLDAQRTLPREAASALAALPAAADPMALLRTTVSLLGVYDPESGRFIDLVL